MCTNSNDGVALGDGFAFGGRRSRKCSSFANIWIPGGFEEPLQHSVLEPPEEIESPSGKGSDFEEAVSLPLELLLGPPPEPSRLAQVHFR